jgi:RNA polymerase sigma-70 factor (ECF subfamily)
MHVDPFHDADELLRRVYAYVAYLVHDRAEAEDITSETFERALRYRDRYDPHKGEPVGWLLGIARRCVYDASLRPRHDAHHEAAGAAADPSETVVVRLELAQALSELSGPDRELLALRYGADLSTREIARLLDMKRNAVDVALTRARTRLRQRLQPPPSGQPAHAPRPASNEL